MVCANRSFRALYSRMQSAPSAARIRQLAQEVRNGWTPQTRAKRAAVGACRLETVLALAQLRNREQVLNRLSSR
jgi:hypothetical protein